MEHPMPWAEYLELVKVLCSHYEGEEDPETGLLFPGATARISTLGLRELLNHPELEMIVPVEYLTASLKAINVWGKYLLDTNSKFKDAEILKWEGSPLHVAYYITELQPTGLIRILPHRVGLSACAECDNSTGHVH